MHSDIDVIDTTPGCGGVFAPPQHPGDASGYLTWAKAQLRSDPWFKQSIAMLAYGVHGKSTYFSTPQVTGEFAETLLRLVDAVDKRCRDLKAPKAA